MNSVTAAERVGITYRQLDHWISQGYLRVTATHPGSGNARNLTGAQVRILEHLASLVRAGVRPAKAAPMARRLAQGKPASLGPFQLLPTEAS